MEVVPGAWSDVVMCPHCGHYEMLGVGRVGHTNGLCAKCNRWGDWDEVVDPIPLGALPVLGAIFGSWNWGAFGGNIVHRMVAAPWHSGCKWSDHIDFFPPLDKWLDHDTVCE